MSLFTNPVFVSVLVLCLLCLAKLNVLVSLLIAALVAAHLGGIGVTDAMDILTNGFSVNAQTALSYILLGTFATAIATTGLADIMSKKLSRSMKSGPKAMLIILAAASCLSQNLIPVHIAFIPILIPPLLSLMNDLGIDRRAAACSLAFGLKAPYIALPFGFGAIFMGLIAKNMTENGMPVTVSDVTRYNWVLGVAMLIGLLIAIFFSYARRREYPRSETDTSRSDTVSETSTYEHVVTLISIPIVVAVQIMTDSLPLAALSGIVFLFIFRAVQWNKIDAQVEGGIKIMGNVAIVMLVAGGYADVIKATGAVDSLVAGAADMMSGSRLVAACVMTLIGLLVTMGIGSSFSTIPVTSVFYVPLCQHMGFSQAATILLLSAAAAIGDAGSPASDTTLGPTSGLNADGKHDHIWDTCVPTFIHYNIPLAIAAIAVSQFI